MQICLSMFVHWRTMGFKYNWGTVQKNEPMSLLTLDLSVFVVIMRVWTRYRNVPLVEDMKREVIVEYANARKYLAMKKDLPRLMMICGQCVIL